jgi:hypothetical protein
MSGLRPFNSGTSRHFSRDRLFRVLFYGCFVCFYNSRTPDISVGTGSVWVLF